MKRHHCRKCGHLWGAYEDTCHCAGPCHNAEPCGEREAEIGALVLDGGVVFETINDRLVWRVDHSISFEVH